MKDEMKNVWLPKWSGLVVVGEPVTKEQAAEILVRTDNWDLFSNDREWDTLASFIGGFKPEHSFWGIPDAGDRLKAFTAYQEERTATKKSLGVLDLEYMTNRRIASSYICGPHGWCDWDGQIGCTNYRIGQYPSVEDVYQEWVRIAEAFPFLKLWSHLYGGEEVETDYSKAKVEFLVAEGRVTVQEPTKKIPEGFFRRDSDMLAPFDKHWERGCTEKQLRDAVDLVKAKFRKA